MRPDVRAPDVRARCTAFSADAGMDDHDEVDEAVIVAGVRTPVGAVIIKLSPVHVRIDGKEFLDQQRDAVSYTKGVTVLSRSVIGSGVPIHRMRKLFPIQHNAFHVEVAIGHGRVEIVQSSGRLLRRQTVAIEVSLHEDVTRVGRVRGVGRFRKQDGEQLGTADGDTAIEHSRSHGELIRGVGHHEVVFTHALQESRCARRAFLSIRSD